MLLRSLRVALFHPRWYSSMLRTQVKPTLEPRGPIQTPQDFLTAIGRSCETKIKTDSWKELSGMRGEKLKKDGLDIKDRRYILWCLNKYRLGKDPLDFMYSEKPKKKIRGWGPKVQLGKRIRSRRYR